MEQEKLTEKKEIKRISNRVGIGLILYSLITIIIVFADATCRTIAVLIKTEDPVLQEQYLDVAMEKFMQEATSMIIGVVLGVLFLLLFFRKKISVKNIFRKNHSMTYRTFFLVLFVFMGVQLPFDGVSDLLEKGLNLIGYSAVESIESMSADSTTISMFLYAGFIGPIVEEVIYRGYVLRFFEKYNKRAAIFISALLFGIMHGNLPQSLFAMGVGFVLGYVAMEYSIVWSIVLHIFNNCLADFLGKAFDGFGDPLKEQLIMAVMALFFIAAVVVLWKKRAEVKKYYTENRLEWKKCFYSLTSVAIIIFIVMELAQAILMLTPL